MKLILRLLYAFLAVMMSDLKAFQLVRFISVKTLNSYLQSETIYISSALSIRDLIFFDRGRSVQSIHERTRVSNNYISHNALTFRTAKLKYVADVPPIGE